MPPDVLTRRHPGEVDAIHFQVRHQLPDFSFERPASDQVKARLWVFFLNSRERPNHHIHAVIGRKAARTDQVRPERVSLAIAKLGKVDQIRHDHGLQIELAENVHQIAGGDNDHIHPRKNEASRAETFQMIARLPASIVDQRLLAAQPAEEPGWPRRKQEGPIRRGENVDDVYVFESAPEVETVNRLAKNRSEARNALSPGQQARQGRIHRNNGHLDIRVALPQPHEQIGLHRLPAHVSQAGRDDRHF